MQLKQTGVLNQTFIWTLFLSFAIFLLCDFKNIRFFFYLYTVKNIFSEGHQLIQYSLLSFDRYNFLSLLLHSNLSKVILDLPFTKVSVLVAMPNVILSSIYLSRAGIGKIDLHYQIVIITTCFKRCILGGLRLSSPHTAILTFILLFTTLSTISAVCEYSAPL